jgi:glyoxylase-like metal-dependent hydrolase (beta-lactamase superfamily II)
VNVHTIDLQFQGLPHAIAAYVADAPQGPVLFETGPGSTLPALVARLAELGYAPGDVRHVFVSHIHLDHAGASGWWASQGAQVYVHPVGAPHLVDPSRLLASAGRIYGDAMDRLWGAMVPAPTERVTAVSDGDTVPAGGLEVHVVDSPGHARHHNVYVVDDVAFTGDIGGVRIDGSRYLDIPAVPPEFDRETWYRSLDRLDDMDLAALYPTHFGRIDDVRGHWREMRELIGELTGLVRGMLLMGADRDTVVREYTAWNHARAAALGVTPANIGQVDLANPAAISVDGIIRYWQKRGAV